MNGNDALAKLLNHTSADWQLTLTIYAIYAVYYGFALTCFVLFAKHAFIKTSGAGALAGGALLGWSYLENGERLTAWLFAEAAAFFVLGSLLPALREAAAEVRYMLHAVRPDAEAEFRTANPAALPYDAFFVAISGNEKWKEKVGGVAKEAANLAKGNPGSKLFVTDVKWL